MNKTGISRRNFLSGSAALSLTPTLAILNSSVHARGQDLLKVGLIGFGGRGTGAITQALMSTKTPVKLWAMADIFRDKLDESYNMLANGAEARYDREAFDVWSYLMAGGYG